MSREDLAAVHAAPEWEEAHAWVAVCDELLRGTGHALSNRLAALSAITQVLENRLSGEPLLRALTGEISRMERTIGLLQLLPRERNGAPEPLRVADLLPELTALHGLQGPLRDVPYEIIDGPDTPPAWIERSALSRSLLLLLSAAAATAQSVGSRTLVVRCGAEEEEVVVAIEPHAAEAAGPWHPAPTETLPAEIAAASALLRDGGAMATVEVCGDGSIARYVLRLPTLDERRRREESAG